MQGNRVAQGVMAAIAVMVVITLVVSAFTHPLVW
jgi:hypothetical protein